MRFLSPFPRRGQTPFVSASSCNRLEPDGSRVLRAIATICACSLVIASMGMGGLFAYSMGIKHGPALAALTVLMAVALEGIKPLAVSAVLTSFRSWAIVRGLLLTLLACVAVAYSLTAELSLVASSRGDVVASRERSIEAHADKREAIKAARAELATLAPARTLAEIQADVTKLLAGNPKAGNCSNPTLNGVARRVCPQVAVQEGERARAERRAELQAIISKATDTPSDTVAVGKADAGSAALATYLGTLGVSVQAGKLSDWLVLVPVLALEVGSALAGLLVQAVGGHSPARQMAPAAAMSVDSQAGTQPASPQMPPVDTERPATGPDPCAKRTPAKRASKPRRGQRSQQPAGLSKTDAENKVVSLLRDHGGQLDDASVRGVAKLIGARKSTVHNALVALMTAGVVTKAGSALVLVG